MSTFFVKKHNKLMYLNHFKNSGFTNIIYRSLFVFFKNQFARQAVTCVKASTTHK